MFLLILDLMQYEIAPKNSDISTEQNSLCDCILSPNNVNSTTLGACGGRLQINSLKSVCVGGWVGLFRCLIAHWVALTQEFEPKIYTLTKSTIRFVLASIDNIIDPN